MGLALEVDGGTGIPLKVKAGQSFFINQIDLRASITATRDEGVDGLRRAGDFAQLPWQGVRLADEEPILLPNPDGTFTRRRFYRDAQWMEQPSVFTVQPVDAQGRPTGRAISLHIGKDDKFKSNDDFFIRRLRAIQWGYDCRTGTDCTGAKSFSEEALVELRNAPHRRHPLHPLGGHPRPAAELVAAPRRPLHHPRGAGGPAHLRVWLLHRREGRHPGARGWHLRPRHRRSPSSSRCATGPASASTRRAACPPTTRSLSGRIEPGIQYYRAFAFIDPSTTYYRRKHRERMLMTQIIGPAQRIQPIRSIVDLDAFLGPDDVQTIATLERDGVYSQFQTFPPANKLFGGAFFPETRGWDAAVSTSWTYQLPANAEPGTYLVTVKGRRTYMGEDIPASRTLEIQVGSPERTQADAHHRHLQDLPHRGRRVHQGAARQRQPRRVRRLPRPAGLRARGPHRGAHALHPLALGPLRRAQGAVLQLPPDAGEHAAHQQGRLPLVPQELPGLARGAVRPHREHVRRRGTRVLPAVHRRLPHYPPG